MNAAAPAPVLVDPPPPTPDRKRLARMKLRASDLQGKSVLDIGTDDDPWFCEWAQAQGASRAVALDLRSETQRLPDGPFDIAFWMSGMEHQRNPKRLLEEIRRALRPHGLLVLECALAQRPGRHMRRVSKGGTARMYPTAELLTQELLRGFAVRRMHDAIPVPGTHLTQDVFHCNPLRPIVNIVRGASGDGKSFLVQRQLGRVATKTYSLDSILTDIARDQDTATALGRAVKEHFKAENLLSTYRALDDDGHADALAGLMADMVCEDDEYVVFEGFITDAVCEALSRRLSAFAHVWHTSRHQAPGPSLGVRAP